ncbi:Rieske 2Fe-2S domain-containing protein [Candidatus Berkiella aquae]|uniref:Aromatic ring-hydroxylating dioxygenase subunit alpha n=1 Tax=Candidatus Berkiella aquae TaxID=295108 RepID=A0A0Q9YMK7_9GAMM|nr:aromatic ring-hydroxylating dioxygenase subunit alpha [Candidatus Berkiella aquae]MCS5710315.1 aromatic ring-hydroxylating dioxygenase subunit alpha [Candidatus Berkiella aquae]
MNSLLQHYWYIVAESSELTADKVLARQILDEWLVVFRGEDNKPCVMRDKCLHRCARLSKGEVSKGLLTCPYHGWVYNGKGQLVSVPAHFGQRKEEVMNVSHAFACIEQEGYIYVCLSNKPLASKPYAMPQFNNGRYKKVRLVNVFNNTLANCVENFIDIPHTAFVHQGIFRKKANEQIKAKVKRENGHIQIDYENEKNNLGSFSWLLNPKKKVIFHQDNYYAPNITHVIYRLTGKWEYRITSQTVPITNETSIVYTEICYDFGLWNYHPFTKWLIKRQAQKVIDQDMNILNDQMTVIKKYGQKFSTTSADLIHHYTSEIIDALNNGLEPQMLPDQEKEITFWV